MPEAQPQQGGACSEELGQLTRWAAASGGCTNTPSPLPFPEQARTLRQQSKAKINHRLVLYRLGCFSGETAPSAGDRGTPTAAGCSRCFCPGPPGFLQARTEKPAASSPTRLLMPPTC